MKYLIASDIHGSGYYCEKLVERFKSENADLLVLLGDILYHGPRNDLPREYAPKKVIEMLNSMSDRIIAVKGNCEAEVDQMVLDFSVMSSSSFIIDGKTSYGLTHGHHLDEFLSESSGHCKAVFFGHTHIPEVKMKQGVAVVNPGSVSIPKENSLHSYIILENMTVIWKDVETQEEYRRFTL